MSMGRIKCILCLKKKQAKNSIYAPEIALKVELSDPARNSYFPADFWVPAYSVVSFSATAATVEILIRYLGEAGGSAD